MKFYRYWVATTAPLKSWGQVEQVKIYGHSDQSFDDALNNAAEQRAAIQERIDRRISWRYQTDMPIREEILEEPAPGNIVSRNRYGCRVLNSETLVFIDIDFATALPKPKKRRPRRPGFLARLFGARPIEEPVEPPPDPESILLPRIRQLCAQPVLADYAVRIYRTKAGLRLMLPGAGLKPEADETEKLMRLFSADELYMLLCRKQGCYRARLTPKPYRIGQPALRHDWPRSPELDAQTRQWNAEYEAKSQKYAVCRYLETLGPANGTGGPMVEYHDRATGAHGGLPLA